MEQQEMANAIAQMIEESRDAFNLSRRLMATASTRARELDEGNYLARLTDGRLVVLQVSAEGDLELLTLTGNPL